jgi:hypothetical protein
MKIIIPTEINDDRLTSTNVAEDNAPGVDPPEWLIGTAYSTDDQVKVTNTTEPNIHRIYQALQATTGDEPWLEPDEENPVNWIIVGSTNAWRMFRSEANDITVNASTITVKITPDARVTSMAFFQLLASSVQVIVNSVTGGGEVFNETIDLNSSAGINSWWNWLWTPLTRKQTLTVFGIPNFKDNIIDIIITGSPNAECGIFVLGNEKEIGESQYGLNAGIRDFSVKETTAFGKVRVSDRGFSDTLQDAVFLQTNRFDDVKKTLTDLRGTPVVWVASEEFEATIVYGFYIRFDPILSNPSTSLCNLKIEGIVQ